MQTGRVERWGRSLRSALSNGIRPIAYNLPAGIEPRIVLLNRRLLTQASEDQTIRTIHFGNETYHVNHPISIGSSRVLDDILLSEGNLKRRLVLPSQILITQTEVGIGIRNMSPEFAPVVVANGARTLLKEDETVEITKNARVFINLNGGGLLEFSLEVKKPEVLNEVSALLAAERPRIEALDPAQINEPASTQAPPVKSSKITVSPTLTKDTVFEGIPLLSNIIRKFINRSEGFFIGTVISGFGLLMSTFGLSLTPTIVLPVIGITLTITNMIISVIKLGQYQRHLNKIINSLAPQQIAESLKNEDPNNIRGILDNLDEDRAKHIRALMEAEYHRRADPSISPAISLQPNNSTQGEEAERLAKVEEDGQRRA